MEGTHSRRAEGVTGLEAADVEDTAASMRARQDNSRAKRIRQCRAKYEHMALAREAAAAETIVEMKFLSTCRALFSRWRGGTGTVRANGKSENHGQHRT
jgi:hypothetical protein